MKPALAWSLRIGGTLLGVAYVAYRVEPDEALSALSGVDAATASTALALTAANMFVGTLRWRTLLVAYGADPEQLPPLAELYRRYLVGLFYNTFLPGAVGGDVVRSVGLREAFGGNATASVSVAFVERVLGLAALLTVATSAFFVWPVEGVGGLAPIAALGLAGALGVVVAIAIGKRFADRLPGVLGRPLGRLPELRREGLPGLLGAFGLSTVIHVGVALIGHLFVTAALPGVALSLSLVVIPVGAAAAFFPSVGGLGAREAAFLELYARVGVDRGPALAASLGIFAVTLAVAAVGGALQFAGRSRAERDG